MKKIIILLFICLGFAKAKAQTFHSYADTANYLIHEIENKKSLYVGQPLSVLLSSLKIQPVYVLTGASQQKTDFGKVILLYLNHEREFQKTHTIIVVFDTVPDYAQLLPVFFPAAGGRGSLQDIVAVYQTLTVKDVQVKDYTNDEPVNPDVHY